MSRSRTVRFTRRLLVATALALALPGAALANQPPEILEATVTPASLPYSGGSVTVTAYVRDIEGAVVGSVWVETGPFFVAGNLTPTGGEEWTGTIELPYNFSPTPVSTPFTVVAQDLDLAEARAAAGTVQVAAYPGFDDPPVVSDPLVSPRDLPSGGGPVTLGMTATDTIGLTETFAIVGGNNIALRSLSGDRYEGVYNAPPNPGTGAVEHTVKLAAADAASQVTVLDAGVIRVAGRPSGRLEVRTKSLDFGSTQVGKRTQRSVVVRNDGGRADLPVQCVITTSGAPFFLAGAPPGGLPFRLRSGESRTFHVEFRPTAAGARSGAVLVDRPDLVQPTLSVPLTGTGAAKRGK